MNVRRFSYTYKSSILSNYIENPESLVKFISMKKRWIVFPAIACVVALLVIFLIGETSREDQNAKYFGPWEIHEPFITHFLSLSTLDYMGVNLDEQYYLKIAPLPENQFNKLKNITKKYNLLTVGRTIESIPDSSYLLELAIKQHNITYNLTIRCDPHDYVNSGYFRVLKVDLEQGRIYREPRPEQGLPGHPDHGRTFISNELYQDLIEFLISLPPNSPLIREADPNTMNAIRNAWTDRPHLEY